MFATRASCPSARLLGLLLFLLCQLCLTGGALVAPVAPVRAAGVAGLLAADGTPVAGRPLVITADDRPRRATPSGEQVLRLAGPRDGPASLDPALARDLSTAFLCRQVFRGLTRLDGDLTAVPELAERIEISADGLVYTFRLRPTAAFHDGRTITAADVVFSLTRALDPATAGGDPALLGGPTYLSDVVGAADLTAGAATELRGVRALDERTVEVRLVAPRATFLMKLAGAPAAVVDPLDVAEGGEWWRSPNGSGPFRVAAWEPDRSLTLAGHDGFAAGPPPLERVEVLLGPEAAQPFNLYQADRVDVAAVPSVAVDRARDPNGELADELTETPLLATAYLAFRTDVAPMDDPHVRLAVQLAFPRYKVAEVGFDGAKLPADGLIPPGMLGRGWPVAAAPYDLAAAKRELAASSYGSAAAVPPIRIYGASTYGAEALREVLEADLGLRVEVVAVEWPEFYDELSRRAYPAYELLWAADYPDPATFLWSLFGSDSPDNYVAYRNDAFDALLREAAATLDVDRRADLYARAHQLLVDDAVVVPLYHDVRYTLTKPYVRGLEVTPLGILSLDDIWLER